MNPLRALFIGLSRMPPAAMLLIIVGLAVVVTMLVTNTIDETKKLSAARTADIEAQLSAKGKVIFATKDVPEGQPIPSDALEEKEIEASKVPPDALTSASLAAGRIAKYGISANQMVSQHDLAPQGIQPGFQSKLKEGMRAVTFAVDNNSGVAGFVDPDSRVDIVAMLGSGVDTKARPILSDVEVIAVGQTYQKAPGQSAAVPASSVTVAVSPSDSLKLMKAITAAGKLYLALRNDKDHTPVATFDVTSMFSKPQSSLNNTDIANAGFDRKLPPPPDVPMSDLQTNRSTASGQVVPLPPPLHEIEMWQGGKKDVLTVPRG
jgi:pilus assembly protein CpaB